MIIRGVSSDGDYADLRHPWRLWHAQRTGRDGIGDGWAEGYGCGWRDGLSSDAGAGTGGGAGMAGLVGIAVLEAL